jgi:transcriptional regulator GlxA family with amidase domain
VQYCELPASPPLDAVVRCFWFLSGDLSGAPPQTVVPDGRLEIILHLADPFRRIGADGEVRTQSRILFSGQLTAPITVCPSGITDIVGIRLRTATANALFSSPLSELSDRVESLEDLASPLATALLDAATSGATPAARANALSGVVNRFVLSAPDALALTAVRALDAPQPPQLAVVAQRLGVSTRTVERRVLDSTGLSPRELRRLLRFRRAFRMLDGSSPGKWTGVAARAGYFDQAHMIRDFRQFAGAAPSEFFSQHPELATAIMTNDRGSTE